MSYSNFATSEFPKFLIISPINFNITDLEMTSHIRIFLKQNVITFVRPMDEGEDNIKADLEGKIEKGFFFCMTGTSHKLL